MADKSLKVIRSGRYGTRMLTAGDPLTLSGPKARAAIALGWVEEAKPRKTNPAAPAPVVPDERAELRAAYVAKFDKRPFPGWDAETLRAKLAE